MLAYFILALTTLIALVVLGRWALNADPHDLVIALRWTVFVAALIGLLAAAILGLWIAAVALSPVMVWWFLKLKRGDQA